jgi:hypothetical protein
MCWFLEPKKAPLLKPSHSKNKNSSLFRATGLIKFLHLFASLRKDEKMEAEFDLQITETIHQKRNSK